MAQRGKCASSNSCFPRIMGMDSVQVYRPQHWVQKRAKLRLYACQGPLQHGPSTWGLPRGWSRDSQDPLRPLRATWSATAYASLQTATQWSPHSYHGCRILMKGIDVPLWRESSHMQKGIFSILSLSRTGTRMEKPGGERMKERESTHLQTS